VSSLVLIHEDPCFVVIDKPPGLLSIPGNISQDSVATRMAALYPDRPGPHVVHRLDMDTSGLMVVALTPEAHRALSIEFEDRVVEKTYVAILDGEVKDDEGLLVMRFRLNRQDRPRQIYDPERGKLGETRYRVLERSAGPRTRVEFRPLTGRTHQLRAQAAHPLGLGAPILGDRLYGKNASWPVIGGVNPPAGAIASLNASGQRLMLHASRLRIAHPLMGEMLEFQSDPPF
jgi:tRNA pseudouridine32 synthase/23S rRNA pseudouridine746 synthase